MRIYCWICNKSVTNEVPNETVLRAVAICPECVEKAPIEYDLFQKKVERWLKHDNQTSK